MIQRSVFKFGGASVKDAESIKNVAEIIQKYGCKELIVVVSAMGKTTNNLEELVDAIFQKDEEVFEVSLNKLKAFHNQIINSLFEDEDLISQDLEKVYQYLEKCFETIKENTYDKLYDQIVATGELISSKLLSAYFKKIGLNHVWIDARKIIGTNSDFRNAKVNLEITQANVSEQLNFKNVTGFYLTQGFIGAEKSNFMTTLGREGSDYTASIFAYCIEAEAVSIWKDVPGFLNADPAYFENTSKLDSISYKEATELAYYGAKIIHPKTIKPLQNKNIPLYIKSFKNPEDKGTRISADEDYDRDVPSYIFKPNQVLFSISPRDYSFILEEDISGIFKLFANHKAKVNTMQNSALMFSVSSEIEKHRISDLVADLSEHYEVKYNTNLELLTIRHYNDKIIAELIKDRSILLEQKTRSTLRILMRSKEN